LEAGERSLLKKGLPYVGVKKAPSLIGEALLNEKESLQEVREGIIKEIAFD
jgi:hypothetical protein